MQKKQEATMMQFKGFLSLSAFALLMALCSQLGIYAAQATEIKQVPTEQVCMVNNAFMAKKQIAIPFEGKTYYGCCQMCVSTLSNDENERHAIDPVNGHRVDKATAIIGALPDGNVFYFENEANLHAYTAQQPGAAQ